MFQAGIREHLEVKIKKINILTRLSPLTAANAFVLVSFFLVITRAVALLTYRRIGQIERRQIVAQ